MDDHEQGVAGLRSIPPASSVRKAQEGRTEQRGLRHRVLRYLLAGLGDPPLHVALWNGERLSPQNGAVPAMQVHIREGRALWPLLFDPWLYFGDLYARGDVEVEGDLVEFLACVYRASAAARQRRGRASFFGWWLHRPRSTSLGRARDNIHAHYDLGNDFYRLWLDREMVYTCAYFPHPQAGLEEAQAAKMHHVCRKLRLRPGDSVVEAGCGWGSLALFMARHYGVRVRAYNISREQIAWARARARDEGLADRVEFVEDDYRNISGSYDAFVSVGMLEHVGIRYYPALGDVIDRVLRDNGRGLIHTIGRAKPGQMNAWIERRIFPGACPPSLDQMMGILEPHRFAVLDVENLRLHYARTIEHWLARFDAAAGEIRHMFDDNFVRSWRLYLCGSIAAFLTGELQLFQVAFNRAGDNEVPWTREHLYARIVPGEATMPEQQAARPAANSGD